MNAALTHEQFLEAVRILAQPTWTDIASVIVAAVVGVVQAGILVWGIRTMTTESVKRDRRHADRHAENDGNSQDPTRRDDGNPPPAGRCLPRPGRRLPHSGRCLPHPD